MIFIDTETSGLNATKNQLLSVAFVPLDPNIKTLSLFVEPDFILWEQTAKNMFRSYEKEWTTKAVDRVTAQRKIEDYLRENFVKAPTPVGWNVGFDLAFLKQLAATNNFSEIDHLSHRSIDMYTMLRTLTGKDINSSQAFKEYGITVEGRHTALGDAEATKELYLKVKNEFETLEYETFLWSRSLH